MNFIPILFSTPMVQAIMAGTKSQTRREIDINPEEWVLKKVYKPHLETHVFAVFTHKENPTLEKRIKFKWGKHFDTLWVRETVGISAERVFYRADNNELENSGLKGMYDFKWKPSIFMKKHLARLFLEIQHISVERLNDIKSDDAIEEGILKHPTHKEFNYIDYHTEMYAVTPIASYMSLWEKINGPKSWNKNPYVWVIEFEKIDKPTEFVCD